MLNIGHRQRDRVRAWAEESVRYLLKDEAGKYPESTIYARCLIALGTEAAQDAGADFDSIEELVYWEPFEAINEFVKNLALSVSDPADYKAKADFWRHLDQPAYGVQHDRVYHIDRIELETAVDSYLDLPVKSAVVDRLLIDMLVACELVAYAKVVYGKVSIYDPPTFQTVKLLDTVKSRGMHLAFWIVVYLIASALAWRSATTWVLWLAAIETALSFASMPFGRRIIRRHNSEVLAPLKAMNGVYSELSSGGSISARFIREQAVKASDVGVGWPGPTYVLLDDAIARGGRI